MLCDIDHGAAKPGVEKDTKAAGWFREFVVDPLMGLFAKLHLTKRGKELLENREYRYISPTFSLDKEGKPVELHTGSLTNMPAFAGYIDPILNSQAEKISDNQDGEVEKMTKEELIDLIKETVKAMNAETVDEVKEEVVEEKVENACSDEEKKVDNACSETKEETVNSEDEPKAEEVKEEVKEEVVETKDEPEEKKEEEKKEEVIKLEALNSAPTALKDVSGSEAWRDLHGKDFWEYLAKHPEIKG